MTEISEAKKLGERFRITIPELMRKGWRPGDLIQFTQRIGSPGIVLIQNLSLEDRRQTSKD